VISLPASIGFLARVGAGQAIPVSGTLPPNGNIPWSKQMPMCAVGSLCVPSRQSNPAERVDANGHWFYVVGIDAAWSSTQMIGSAINRPWLGVSKFPGDLMR